MAESLALWQDASDRELKLSGYSSMEEALDTTRHYYQSRIRQIEALESTPTFKSNVTIVRNVISSHEKSIGRKFKFRQAVDFLTANNPSLDINMARALLIEALPARWGKYASLVKDSILMAILKES
jgi:hypothetical protein